MPALFPVDSIAWCHLAPAAVFAEIAASDHTFQMWRSLQRHDALQVPFFLLPATSSIGSYKNPEVLAEALASPTLSGISLLLCGLSAQQSVLELKSRFPHLDGRIYSAGFTDVELALVYRHALAVVIPSLVEGSTIEVMAAGGLPLVVILEDCRGRGELRYVFLLIGPCPL